jgi:voltage-gated potassium channel
VIVTGASGLLVCLTDPASMTSIGTGLWWSLQTVTTVGYGDVVPNSVPGRLTAALVMLAGLSLLAVTTAAVTNAFVQAATRRRRRDRDDPVLAQLTALREESRALAPACNVHQAGRTGRLTPVAFTCLQSGGPGRGRAGGRAGAGAAARHGGDGRPDARGRWIEAAERMKAARPSTLIVLISTTHPDELPLRAGAGCAEEVIWKSLRGAGLLDEIWLQHRLQ